MAMNKGYLCLESLSRGNGRPKCKTCFIEAEKVIQKFKKTPLNKLSHTDQVLVSNVIAFLIGVVGQEGYQKIVGSDDLNK